MCFSIYVGLDSGRYSALGRHLCFCVLLLVLCLLLFSRKCVFNVDIVMRSGGVWECGCIRMRHGTRMICSYKDIYIYILSVHTCTYIYCIERDVLIAGPTLFSGTTWFLGLTWCSGLTIFPGPPRFSLLLLFSMLGLCWVRFSCYCCLFCAPEHIIQISNSSICWLFCWKTIV